MQQLQDKTFPQLTEELKNKLKADLEKWEPVSPLDPQPEPTIARGTSANKVPSTEQKPAAGKKNNQGQVTSTTRS